MPESQPWAIRGPAVIGDHVVPDAVVVVDGDRIAEVRPAVEADLDTEAAGGTIAPGYVDIHCHGGGGAAFTDLDADQAAAAARHHHARGTTSLLASLVTATPDDLDRGVRILADLADDGLVDGIHLEGPWLAEARCGAHDPALLRDPDPAEVDALLAAGRGHIRQVTYAPERQGAAELVARLVGAGVHPAVGHTVATHAEASAAVRQGATIATHLFNGMDPWHHRRPGAIPALLAAAASGATVLELIADGVHLADETALSVLGLVGPGQVALVSDSIAAAGLGDGRYVLGGLAVSVDEGVSRLDESTPDGSPASIAGGTSHLADIAARVARAGVGIAVASASASVTPARLMGLKGRDGGLKAGSRADLVVLDETNAVQRVLRQGVWVPRA